MKYALLFLISVSAFTITNAQSKSKSISTSSKKSETKIKVNSARDVKLDLISNDKVFDMTMTHPKQSLVDVKNIFNSHFGNHGKSQWSDNDSNSMIRMKGNKLIIKIDKREISDEMTQLIESFTNDIFLQLDWDIEELGLNNYSGEWTLVK